MKNKLFIWGFCFMLSFELCYSQKMDGLDAYLFSIENKNDTINFLKINADLDTVKPVLIFCLGSLPIPLIGKDGSKCFFLTLPFNYKKLSEAYNLIVISMPHTPVVAALSLLDKNYAYLPDPTKAYHYDHGYIRDNYLMRYVERANEVISFLVKQRWVDNEKIYVAGHSQGSYIATSVARSNPLVKALGYFSGNPDGRYTQFIKHERLATLAGRITDEEAQKNINSYYDQWRLICKNSIPEGHKGDLPYTWTSFSMSVREILTDLNIPIYIAYGTRDIVAEGCDLLPIYFELREKNNYKLQPFVGCGHNFEMISFDGKPDYNKMYWDEAMFGFTDWIESLY